MAMTPAPAVVEISQGLVLQGQALIDVAMLASYAIKAAASDTDGRIPPRLRRLAEMLENAAHQSMSASGHADMAVLPIVTTSLVDEVTTKEAAQMLSIGQRQMCRLATELGGRRTTAGWLIRRGAVVAYRQEKGTAA